MGVVQLMGKKAKGFFRMEITKVQTIGAAL